MNLLIEALGWTLVHFLWQGAVIAVLLGGALWVFRPASAPVRYHAAGVALVAMLLVAGFTAVDQWQRAADRARGAETLKRDVTHSASAVSTRAPARDREGGRAAAFSASGPESEAGRASDSAIVAGATAGGPLADRAPLLPGSARPDWLRWVVRLWALGVALFSFRLLRSWRALVRLRGASRIPEDAGLLRVFDRLRDRICPRQSVVLLVNATSAVPLVAGWLRPAIIVPAGLLSRLPAWQLEAILAHELSHVRRRDYLVNLLQNIVETVFFYHPAVWWVSAQLRKEREHCCDDAAAEHCGGALDYARALTALEEARGHLPAVAVTANGGSLPGRIRRLLGAPSREAGSASFLPAGLALSCIAMALLAGVHFARGNDGRSADVLPDAPKHEMAIALVHRWQSLQENESPTIPESRVAVVRGVIADHLEREDPPDETRRILTRYQNWRRDRGGHGAEDLVRLLNAIAAVEPDLVQSAFNDTPRRGIDAPRDAARFGPPAPNGLRASWTLRPEREVHVSGDVLHGVLTLWNTGEETLLVGGDPEATGLRPQPVFRVEGETGRRIEILAEPVDPVSFTAKWLLQPGESAEYGGYRIKLGTGEEREATFKPKHSSEFAIPDIRSGEMVKLTATFPYPSVTRGGVPAGRMETPEVAFEVLDPDEVKVWSTNRPGTWPMAGGVTLEIRGEVFHGADVLTTARLRWPDGRLEEIHVAADAFGNRDPWAIVWDAGSTILWIGKGALGSRLPAGAGEPLPAESVLKVDFQDPLRIDKSTYTGWPTSGDPSEACRAAMARHFVVKPDGTLASQRFGWSSIEEDDGRGKIMSISVFVGEDGSFRVNEEEVAVAGEDRAQAVQKLHSALGEAAKRERENWNRGSLVHGAEPPPTSISIFAAENVPYRFVTEAMDACRDANLDADAQVTLKRVAADKPVIRGLSLAGEPLSLDITRFDDLYEADPERPGEVRRKDGVFFMSLGRVGPWLYRPANAGHFYVEVRPDPEVVEDVIYGPIEGDPVEKLDLAGWLRESAGHPDPGYARRVARDMLRSGDTSLAQTAIAWMRTFPEPSPPSEYADLGTALDDFIHDFPQSPVIDEARALRERLDSLREAADIAWNAKRPQLPDEQYTPGTPVGDVDADIAWGERSDAPMRLGIAGIAEGAQWRRGDSVTFDLYLCNESDEPVRFAWTPRHDEGLSVELVDARGQVHAARIVRFSAPIFHSRTELQPAEVLKLKSGVTLLVGEPVSDTRNAVSFLPIREPGKATLRVTCHVGISDWSDDEGNEIVRPAGEWEGEVQANSPEVMVVVGNAEAGTDVEAGGPSADRRVFLGRPLGEWDGMLTAGVPRHREELKAIGFGKADVAIPEEALPLWLELLDSGSAATQCRCLGTLRKLPEPSDAVLDAVLSKLERSPSANIRHRTGYLLGDFRARADYTVPRLVSLLEGTDAGPRAAAVFALGRIGPNARAALPALESLRARADEQFIEVIDRAVMEIRDTSGDAARETPGIVLRLTDGQTGEPVEKFRVIAGVPSSVSEAFESDHDTEVVVWQSHMLREGSNGEFVWPEDRGYERMALRVEADGHVPQVVHGLKKGDREIIHLELQRDPGIGGSVQTPGNRRPAHDATVALAMIRRNARLSDATQPKLVRDADAETLRDLWDQPRVFTPDEQGRFTLPTEIDPTAVVLIVHGDGVYERSYAEWREAPDVTLEPWGRIHGQVQWGGTPGANEQVELIINRGDRYGYPDIVAQYARTTTHAEGVFVFERVLPGLVQLSCPIEVVDENGGTTTAYVEGRIIHAEIQAPHTPVLVGGRGRMVSGRLTGLDDASDVTFHIHPTAPHIGFPGDDTMWRAWNALREAPAGESFFRSSLPVAVDGAFQIPAVLPGRYQIFFSRLGAESYIASGQFHIPAEDRDRPPDAIDLGEIAVRQ